VKFLTFRRYYLDKFLEKYKNLFYGKVLDIGGKKNNRRGNFLPPYDQVVKWIFLNNDKSSNPDILSNLPTIPLDDNSIDLIVCTEVMEYIDDYKRLLIEINRVLKNNGLLILSTPFIHALHNDDEFDYFRFTEPMIKNELSNNFIIEKFHRMGNLFEVILDLIIGYLSYQTKKTWIKKITLRILKLTGLILVSLKKNSHIDNNYWINTGYFVVAKKNENT